MTRAPSPKAIRAFASVSRHLSFQLAANELRVTPTAISHQIRNLEQLAGTRLFNRGPGGVTLTEQGSLFAGAVLPAMEQIDRAFEQLANTREREKIVLGAGPIVASRWLAPRLPEFFRRHPEVDLQIINSPTQIWQRAGEFDLAIAWGEGNWPGLQARKLLDVKLVPILAPRLANRLDLKSPTDLLDAPLIHHRNSTEWNEWFETSGLVEQSQSGTTVDDTNVAVQAALSGSGVILGIREFLSAEISAGHLICPFPLGLRPSASYFLVRSDAKSSETVAKLLEWLLECADTLSSECDTF